MANYTTRGMIRSLFGFGFGFGFGMAVIGGAAVTELQGSDEQDAYPETSQVAQTVDSNLQNSDCNALAAAYAAALANLELAEQLADAAYLAWYECEMGQGNNDDDVWQGYTQTQPATFSILER